MLFLITSVKFDFLCVLSHSVMSDSVRPRRQQPTRLLCPWGLSRQEYWSGLPCPTPGDLPNPGIKTAPPEAPALQADSTTEPPEKPLNETGHTEFVK